MKRIFSFNAWLSVIGSLSIALVSFPQTGQMAFGANTQTSTTHKSTTAKSKKTGKKTAAKPSKKTVAKKPAAKSKVAAKDELPEVQTTTAAGEDVDPRVLANAYGKQANTYYAMALKKEKAGRTDEALKLYFKSLAVRQRVWGNSDPNEAGIIYKIGDIHLKKGRLTEADVCYKRGVALLSKRYGPGAYELAPWLNRLGEVAAKQKRYQDACDNYTRAVALEERSSGADSPQTISARLNLIESCVGLKDWSEAEKQLKLADQALTGKNDTHSKNYLRLLDSYAAVTTALNRTAEANTYSSKAQALRGELGSTAANPPEEKSATPGADKDASTAPASKPAKSAHKHAHAHSHAAKKHQPAKKTASTK